MKKVNTMGIVGKVFNCRIQLFEFFVIRGHKRSTEVIKGQMEVKNKKMEKFNNMGIVGKVFNCRIQLLENFCH